MKRTSKHTKAVQKTAPSENLIAQLHNAVNSRKSIDVQKIILKMEVSELEIMPYFAQLFVSKFDNNAAFVSTIFRIILEKIEANSKPTELLQQLKADSLFHRAEAIIKNSADESAEIRIFHLKPSLLTCEKANAIYYNDIEISTASTKYIMAINTFIKNTIST